MSERCRTSFTHHVRLGAGDNLTQSLPTVELSLLRSSRDVERETDIVHGVLVSARGGGGLHTVAAVVLLADRKGAAKSRTKRGECHTVSGICNLISEPRVAVGASAVRTVRGTALVTVASGIKDSRSVGNTRVLIVAAVMPHWRRLIIQNPAIFGMLVTTADAAKRVRIVPVVLEGLSSC